MKKPVSALILSLLLATGLTSGCAKKAEDKKSGPPPANISVAAAQNRDVVLSERSVGEVDSAAAPKVAAEVAGRIVKVNVEIGDPVKFGQVLAELDGHDYQFAKLGAQAEVARLEATLATQARQTERYRELVKKNFISPLAMDQTESLEIATREQLAAAQALLERADYNLKRTHIVAPVSGRVDQRMISVGDWIELGKPLFQVATSDKLRIRLPFPEGAAARIKAGQTVLLSTPAAPGETLDGRIEQIRPVVSGGSRAFDAIVEVKNPGLWRPGASVNGEVVVETHPGAVTVPEQSVVLRPAGKVVYVLEGDQVLQHPVKTGIKRDGQVEIVEGLKAGEIVAVDGAGFLTDKAKVAVQQKGEATKQEGKPEGKPQ